MHVIFTTKKISYRHATFATLVLYIWFSYFICLRVWQLYLYMNNDKFNKSYFLNNVYFIFLLHAKFLMKCLKNLNFTKFLRLVSIITTVNNSGNFVCHIDFLFLNDNLKQLQIIFTQLFFKILINCNNQIRSNVSLKAHDKMDTRGHLFFSSPNKFVT